MRKGAFSKKMLSVLLAGSMVVGSASVLSGCGTKKKNGVVKLDVYSQLANTQGMQTGWGADVLKEKFNVELNIIPDADGVYQTRAQKGDLGDIVIWGSDSKDYVDAVKNNLLLDWNEDDLLTDCGPYIKKHMSDALKKNSGLTKTITDGERDTTYGIGHSIATSSKDHDAFFYTWDTRWDLYKKLGYPKVKNLQDYHKMLKNMQKLCPSDDSGNKVYAVSLWPDWDDAMVMYVKAMATAYYGYDELALGLYDPTNGKYHDALEENGPYLEMLKWFNDLYQDGLIDPDSMTQTYDEMIAKVQNGGTLFSIFNYSGSLGYNTKEHTSAGKLMYCMKPEDASPIVYGMNTQGGDRIWSIGAKTEYPEKCMEIINYLSTPEGRMTMEYGPKGYTWDYDDQKHAYLTDVGMKCQKDKNTTMGGGYKGSYHDGELQINNVTWSLDASNPDSDGETYNKESWASYNATPSSDIEKDWRDKTGCTTINEYMEKGKYTVAPGTSFSKETQDTTLKTTWNQVTTESKNSSWIAFFAKSDKKFDSIVAGMKKSAKKYGYDKCVEWSRNQASRRKALEDAITR